MGGAATMSKVIEAVFEDGVFKPLKKVDVPEHKKLRIILADKVQTTVKRKCSLEGIIDIAKDCYDTDLSIQHDKYLYGGSSD
jgi:predicted DNA-binding antitoxin AbrB/MazE fold protein